MTKWLFAWILALLMCSTAGVYLYIRIKRSLRVLGVSEFGAVRKLIIMLASVFICLFAANVWADSSIVALHFLIIMLLMDLVVFIYGRIRKKCTGRAYVIGDKPCMLRKLYETGVLALVLTAVICIYGFINAGKIVETDYTVDSGGKLDNEYSILYLSDLHMGNIDDETVKGSLKKLYDRKFDMVVLGGDITDERTTKEETEAVFEMLGKFDTRYGIFYTYGNHDLNNFTHKQHYVDEESYEALLMRSGIVPFADDTRVLNDELVLIGRKDMGYGSPDYDEVEDSKSDPDAVRMTMKELIADANGGEGFGPSSDRDSKFYISLDHQPEGFDESVAESIELTVSGHTHAGQIFPMGAIARLTGSYNYGRYEEKSHNRKGVSELIVSSGVCMWSFPFRTEKKSEYNVITVK